MKRNPSTWSCNNQSSGCEVHEGGGASWEEISNRERDEQKAAAERVGPVSASTNVTGTEIHDSLSTTWSSGLLRSWASMVHKAAHAITAAKAPWY
jgi:hypothetical protein